MASLQLSDGLLEQFVRYQQTLLDALARAGHEEWSGRYAFAHGAALQAAELDLVVLGKLKAMVGEYCGKRSAVLEVQERVEHAELDVARARAANLAPRAKDLALIERAKDELPSLGDLGALEARYGKLAIELMQAKEGELIRLHRALAKAEGTGHVHVAAPSANA